MGYLKNILRVKNILTPQNLDFEVPRPNKPKMAYSRDALLENSKRQERDKTRVRLERAMEDGLS